MSRRLLLSACAALATCLLTAGAADAAKAAWPSLQAQLAQDRVPAGSPLAMFYSSDGGATWKRTVLPRDPTEAFQSDPAVDWTSDGTAWATTISVFTSPFRLFLHSYKSTDGGASWKMDATISSSDQSSADKQIMWTDHSEQSPFKDNIYVIWHDGRAVFVSHHTPGGGWSDPLRVSGGETIGTGIGSDIKADGLGRVFAFWPDTGSRKIYVATSTDGGQSFAAPKAVSPTFQSFQTILPAQASRGALLYTTAGVQLNGTRTNVYVAWADP